VGKTVEKLTALAVTKLKKPGRHNDGAGLYLQIGPAGNKSWIFRYKPAGFTSSREMGLGALHTFTLAEARDRAAKARKLLAEGIDPIDAKGRLAADAATHAARAKTAGKTFDEGAEDFIALHQSGWKNVKHGEQWRNTLATYASPVIGKLPLSSIDTEAVLKVLRPIWVDKTETATRVRGRIEQVLDSMKPDDHSGWQNPARWRGHLDKKLPKPRKVTKVESHAALPYADIGAFMVALRTMPGLAPLATEFTILTACRTSEAIGAQWSEIDIDARLWIIPAERIKAGREHRVPLSDAALSVLQSVRAHGVNGEFVFPGRKPDTGLSNMSMAAVLDRMGRDDITVHGFRSTFKDWAAEQTAYPNEVSEMALAHVVRDKTEAAYRRGDLFDKRVRLMADWAEHCAGMKAGGEVIPINRTAAAR
jgi:integrase